MGDQIGGLFENAVKAAKSAGATARDRAMTRVWTGGAAFEYMGLRTGAPIAGTPTDRVFIVSCAAAAT